MTRRIDDLIAELMSLSSQEREHFVRLLSNSVHRVRDGEDSYESSTSTDEAGMKRVTVVLPDDLVKQAQAAGLLGHQRFEQLIRQALRDHDRGSTGERRRIVRRNGRLIVEALPGELPTTDADVRNALDEMDW